MPGQLCLSIRLSLRQSKRRLCAISSRATRLPMPTSSVPGFSCWRISTRLGATRRSPVAWTAVSTPSSTGVSAGSRPRASRMRRGLVPPAPSRHSSGRRLSRWHVVRPVPRQTLVRWSGEKLAHVAVEQHIVEQIAAGTIRAWLRQDKIKPWRYHSWQRSTDPHFVDKAHPVLDLYEHAPALAAQAKRSCAVMRKPPSRPGSGSVQRKQRHPATQSTSRIGINGWVPCNCSVL